MPLFTELPRETVRKGYEQRSARGFSWYTEGEIDRKALFDDPHGYATSVSEAFRTVSEEVFSDTHIQHPHINRSNRGARTP